MTILYFTATGNSLHVAKAFGGELLSIPAMVKAGTYEFTDDKIGVVFPIYSNKVMPFVEEFLMKAKFNCDYLFAIGTYGILAGATANHLQDIAQRAGYQFDYINKIKMVDTWLPGFKMESQIKGEHKKEIEKHLALIVSDVKESKKVIDRPNLLNRVLTRIQLNNATKPHPNGGVHGAFSGIGIKNFASVDGCIGCGTCAKVCPVDNITVDKESKTISFGSHCLSCFACVHNCPTTAIHLKGERSSARYRNKNVTLKEIIEANNR